MKIIPQLLGWGEPFAASELDEQGAPWFSDIGPTLSYLLTKEVIQQRPLKSWVAVRRDHRFRSWAILKRDCVLSHRITEATSMVEKEAGGTCVSPRSRCSQSRRDLFLSPVRKVPVPRMSCMTLSSIEVRGSSRCTAEPHEPFSRPRCPRSGNGSWHADVPRRAGKERVEREVASFFSECCKGAIANRCAVGAVGTAFRLA